MRRIILTVLISVFYLCSSYAQEKPNIIIFLVDDMGLMDTSLPFITDGKGHPIKMDLNGWYRTPHMERLAERGICFSNFYAHTVCSPTRISIMTGQNSARHGTTQWISPLRNNKGKYGPPDWNWTGLKSNDITIPKLLSENGYTTIHVGKGHFGSLGSEGADPLNLGFDVNIAGFAFGSPGSYYGTDSFGNDLNGKKKNNGIPGLEQYHGKDIFLTEALTVEAKKEIDKAVNQKKPFYLYMSHYAVHSPFMSDKRFAENYINSDKSDAAKALATMIEGMDKSLGDILDHIEALGIDENTLIFFLGDNGSNAPYGSNNNIGSSAPLRGKKGSKWEGGTRVPFIAAWVKDNPKNKWQKQLKIHPGDVQEQFGTCYDLFPTIMEFLEIPIPSTHMIDGESLKKLLSGKADKKRKDIFLSHFPHWHRSNLFTTIRKGDWKLIYHYFPEVENTDRRYLLFNLKEDPTESNDLAKKNPDKLKEMMELMVEELENKGALYPVKDGEIVKPIIP